MSTDLAASAGPPVVPALPSATRLAIGDTLPLAAAVLPFGLAIGATIADSELWAPGALAGAVLLMAGASQLAVVGLLDSGAGIAVAVGTALLLIGREQSRKKLIKEEGGITVLRCPHCGEELPKDLAEVFH